MTPNEYLDKTKEALGVESDYELAKRLDLPRQSLPAIRRGERHMPLDVAFRIAITLSLDPACVVADLEAQRAKSEKAKGFWTGFLQRAAIVAALVCTLALNSFGISASGVAAPGGAFNRRPRFG